MVHVRRGVSVTKRHISKVSNISFACDPLVTRGRLYFHLATQHNQSDRDLSKGNAYRMHTLKQFTGLLIPNELKAFINKSVCQGTLSEENNRYLDSQSSGFTKHPNMKVVRRKRTILNKGRIQASNNK